MAIKKSNFKECIVVLENVQVEMTRNVLQSVHSLFKQAKSFILNVAS